MTLYPSITQQRDPDPIAAEEIVNLAIHQAALEIRDAKNRLTDSARQMRITQGPLALIHDLEKIAADLNVLESVAWQKIGEKKP